MSAAHRRRWHSKHTKAFDLRKQCMEIVRTKRSERKSVFFLCFLLRNFHVRRITTQPYLVHAPLTFVPKRRKKINFIKFICDEICRNVRILFFLSLLMHRRIRVVVDGAATAVTSNEYLQMALRVLVCCCCCEMEQTLPHIERLKS